jgi:hypothetical protein
VLSSHQLEPFQRLWTEEHLILDIQSLPADMHHHDVSIYF